MKDDLAGKEQHLKTLVKAWEMQVNGFVISNTTINFLAHKDTAGIFLKYRDKIRELGGDNISKVQKIDKSLLKRILKSKSDFDNADEPLEMWWWHHKDISYGSYPIELLPEYLKGIYISMNKKESRKSYE